MNDLKTTHCDRCPLFTVCVIWRGRFYCVGCWNALGKEAA